VEVVEPAHRFRPAGFQVEAGIAGELVVHRAVVTGTDTRTREATVEQGTDAVAERDLIFVQI